MPYQLYTFFPMASLIGSLLGLGILANQSELIVMQASGFSKGQITLTVLKVAFIMVVIALVLGEIIAPVAESYANYEKSLALSAGQAINTNYGLWIKEGDQFIHIDNVSDQTHLSGISIYQFDDNHQLKKAISADQAQLNADNQWELSNIKQTLIATDHTESKTIAKELWNVRLDPTLLTISNSNTPDTMSLIKLRDYIDYLTANGMQANQYQMNFWKRIFQPLATAIMIFLAIPFVFGSMRSVTMGVRVLTGVTIGFTFYILNQFFAPISLLYQVPPLLGASLPTILFFIAAVAAVALKKQ
jgi:lipopolysaccharide export system permease protein